MSIDWSTITTTPITTPYRGPFGGNVVLYFPAAEPQPRNLSLLSLAAIQGCIFPERSNDGSSAGIQAPGTAAARLCSQPQRCGAMSVTEKKLNDLFLATLKDVYYAEKAILRALPKMAKGGPVWRPPQTRKLIP